MQRAGNGTRLENRQIPKIKEARSLTTDHPNVLPLKMTRNHCSFALTNTSRKQLKLSLQSRVERKSQKLLTVTHVSRTCKVSINHVRQRKKSQSVAYLSASFWSSSSKLKKEILRRTSFYLWKNYSVKTPSPPKTSLLEFNSFWP